MQFPRPAGAGSAQSVPALSESAPPDALARAVRRAMFRLAPLLMLMYVVSFLDRANIGFAKQALAASEGIDERVYALAAGLFFLGYSTCGFPSNLVLHRVGAKLWIGVLMVAWGLASMATMFVTGARSFYLLRLALGATEAGFFPGMVFYLTLWFPARVRGQVLGIFYLGVPLALVLGGPLSGALLDLGSRGGLAGWQWMFLVEGLMAVVLGFAAFALLDDRPAHARWLLADEKHALEAQLAGEESLRRSTGAARLAPMLRDPKVLGFLLVYILIQMSTYGAVFYLPAEVSTLIHQPEGFIVGALSAVPWICALAAVYLLPRAGDIFRNHRQLASLTLLAAALASFAFPSTGPALGLLALSIAVSGFIAVQPLFWTFPTGYLADRAAAGGIAFIGMGNIGGFLAPTIKVWADERFHSPSAGLYLLASLTLLNAALIAVVARPAHNRAAQFRIH